MPAVHMIAKGRVQGVGFRASAQQKAAELGIRGWVKNQPDGDVEIEAEGQEKALKQFAASIRQGFHPFMKVEKLIIRELEEEPGYTVFEIVH